MPKSDLIKKNIQGAVKDGLFASIEVLAARGDEIAFHHKYKLKSGQKYFDLASLTKPLATALLTLIAEQRYLLTLDENVAKFFPTKNLQNVTLRELLTHRSPLIDWKDFRTKRTDWKKINFNNNRKRILDEILNDPKVVRQSRTTLYSDLGYIVLGNVLEKVFQKPLDEIFKKEIAVPLKIEKDVFYISLAKRKPAAKSFVATVTTPDRGNIQGAVMDDNAALMGGVSGHAGLFGTARAVHKILLELRAARNGQSKLFSFTGFMRYCHPDPKRKLSVRFFTPGFDTPTQPGSQSGRTFSKQTIGHLGFSGTSFWWDLQRDFWIILLTNRCLYGTVNPGFAQWRPKFHDTIMRSFA